MRTKCLLAIIALIVFGCGEKEAEVSSEQQKSEAASKQHIPASQAESGGTEAAAGDPAGESSVHPALRDYEYPGAEFDGTFSMGNIVSVSYRSGDELVKVVEFYKKKPLDPVEIADTRAYFAKDLPEGAFTVTLTPGGNFTQIILKLEKKH